MSSVSSDASRPGSSPDGHVEEEKNDNEEGEEGGSAHHDSDQVSSGMPAPQHDDSDPNE